MTTLICTVGVGKGTWNELKALINAQEWSDVYVVGNEFSTQKFCANTPYHGVLITEEQTPTQQQQSITQALKEAVCDTEVAVCIASGNGKEHFSLITALMSLGLGIRFVMLEKGVLITC